MHRARVPADPGPEPDLHGLVLAGHAGLDFTENPDGTIDFKEAGYFIPANANTWVSPIFKAQRNADGTFTYWGATGDFNLGEAGRNAIDVYKVTLPAPPDPQGGTGTQGAPALPSSTSGPGGERCATVAGFRRVGAKRAKRGGLRLNFTRQSSRSVRVDCSASPRAARSRSSSA